MQILKSIIALKRKQTASNKPSWFTVQKIMAALISVGFYCHTVNAADISPEKPLGQITDNLRLTGEFRACAEIFDFFQPVGGK